MTEQLIEKPQMVRCNMCYFLSDEENLPLFPDGQEFFKGCPNCKTDSYLMDMEE